MIIFETKKLLESTIAFKSFHRYNLRRFLRMFIPFCGIVLMNSFMLSIVLDLVSNSQRDVKEAWISVCAIIGYPPTSMIYLRFVFGYEKFCSLLDGMQDTANGEKSCACFVRNNIQDSIHSIFSERFCCAWNVVRIGAEKEQEDIGCASMDLEFHASAVHFTDFICGVPHALGKLHGKIVDFLLLLLVTWAHIQIHRNHKLILFDSQDTVRIELHLAMRCISDLPISMSNADVFRIQIALHAVDRMHSVRFGIRVGLEIIAASNRRIGCEQRIRMVIAQHLSWCGWIAQKDLRVILTRQWPNWYRWVSDASIFSISQIHLSVDRFDRFYNICVCAATHIQHKFLSAHNGEGIYERSNHAGRFVHFESSILLSLQNLVNSLDLDLLYPVFLVLACLSVLFIFFFVGQSIQTDLARISNDVYLSEWIHYPRNARRYVLLMLMQSQRPFHLTTCGYIKLNYESFVGVSDKFCKQIQSWSNEI